MHSLNEDLTSHYYRTHYGNRGEFNRYTILDLVCSFLYHEKVREHLLEPENRHHSLCRTIPYVSRDMFCLIDQLRRHPDPGDSTHPIFQGEEVDPDEQERPIGFAPFD